MPGADTDPARLKGEALNSWYRRSPDEVEAERRAAEEQRYRDFFEGPQSTTEAERPAPSPASNPDVLWVANGYGRYRAVRPGQRDYFAATDLDAATEASAYLPANPAEVEEGDLLDIGNPHNRRLRREWVAKNGPWPQTADGRNYHVAHIKATADGGTQTLDNIRPMDPEEHMAEHKRGGDFRRFGARGPEAKRAKAAAVQSSTTQASTSSGAALAGGRGTAASPPKAKATAPSGPVVGARSPAPTPVRTPPAPSRPAPSPGAKSPPVGARPRLPPTRGGPTGALGVAGLLMNLSGLVSGRIRTDTPEHFWYDMVGFPAPDDPTPDLYL